MYIKNYGKDITTSVHNPSKKRPDFVMLHVGTHIELVEIKKPDYRLTDAEFDSILEYEDRMRLFLKENRSFIKTFPLDVHITLICDKLNLRSLSSKHSFDKFEKEQRLTRKTWRDVLEDTRQVHKDFLSRLGP